MAGLHRPVFLDRAAAAETEMTVLEKAAREVFANDSISEPPSFRRKAWNASDVSQETRHRYMSLAYVAIEAIREPAEAVLICLYGEIEGPAVAGEAWSRAIDAILNEGAKDG